MRTSRDHGGETSRSLNLAFRREIMFANCKSFVYTIFKMILNSSEVSMSFRSKGETKAAYSADIYINYSCHSCYFSLPYQYHIS